MNTPPQVQNCHQTVTSAWIAIGSNLPGSSGSPLANVDAAFAALKTLDAGARLSPLYRTPAFPAGAGPDFINAVAELSWPGTAQDLLEELHAIEAELGRERRDRWEARVVDLDLLAFGEQVLPDPETENHWRNLDIEQAKSIAPDELILPHPRLSERAFVLVPLAALRPDWRHPATGQTAEALRDALPASDLAAIVPL